MAIIFGSDKSGNANNWISNNLDNSASTATAVTFTSTGEFNWTAPAGVTSVSYLVVAGGGGGYIGGGGAGGMLTGTLSVTPGTTYSGIVGAGGGANANGSNSVFSSITSLGGGGGAAGGAANSGGSGGGGSYASGAGGAGTGGQGNNGGNGSANSGGGGGGAGATGGTAPSAHVGGAGGAGTISAISGTSLYYAGGGGGGGTNQGSGGAGGAGGGGAGRNDGTPGTAGTPNTGGGSGGNASGLASAANGGSGIVILSYSAQGTTYDSMVDVPGIANAPSQQDVGGVVRGNYCTLNPLANGTNLVVDTGLLSVSNSSQESNHRTARATMGVSSGKWYWEVHVNNSANVDIVGIVTDISSPNTYVGATAKSFGWGYNTSQAAYYGAGEWVSSGTAPAYTASGVIGIALDLDDGKIWFSNNGTWLTTATGVGNPYLGTYPTATYTGPKTTTFFPAVSIYYNTGTWNFNFGQRAFKFAPPAGFKSLNTTNLPNPVIKRPSNHFDVKTYTGNGTAQMIGNTPKQTSAVAINKSLRFKASTSSYLTRTPAAASNRKTWTWSAWIKRGNLATNDCTLFNAGITGIGTDNVGFLGIRFTSNDQLDITTGGTDFRLTTQAFRDTTSWYHIVVAFDTTQVNAFNRLKLYVNGTQITAFQNLSNPPLNLDTAVNNNVVHEIGRTTWTGTTFFDGYMAEVNFIDGQQLTPSSLGQFDANNNWMPKTYTGTYGTNGFYLPFTSPSTADTASYAGNFTGGAGSSTQLVTSTNANLALGTNNFTVEYWCTRANPASGGETALTFGTGQDTYSALFGYSNADGTMATYMSSNGSSWDIVSGNVIARPMPAGQWAHIAITRSGSTFTAYFNGKQTTTWTSSASIFQNANSISIGKAQGGNGSGNGAWNGLISNVRVVIGSVLYTGNFTPSNAPLTAVTNTRLLTMQDSTIIDNSTNALTFTNTGSVVTTSAIPWRGTVGSDVSGNYNNLYLNGLNTVPTTTNAPNVLYYGTPGTYSWTAPAGVTSVNYLVVAGGGGGGGDCAGGGGGGMLTGTLSVTPSTSYTVTVGAGGLPAYPSTNGKNSVFSSITAIGGGSGGDDAYAGGNGGSGGGGGYNAGAAAGTGTAGQGNNGGSGQSGAPYATGGGGGAGGVGAPYNTTGNGGPGLASSITGTTTYYAGGGGGRRASPGVGGIGGGGTANLTLPAGANGVDGLGGGGGGSGNGGSGVVILSYTNAASYSGNGVGSSIGNDATSSSPVDTVDSNGNTIGNYAVLNPNFNSGSATISNGGLSLYSSNSGAHKIVPATLPISSGKWYFEMTLTGGTPSNAYVAMGLIPYPVPTNSYYTNLPSSVSGTNGFSWQTAGSSTSWVLWTDYDSAARYVTITTGAAAAVGDTMQIAIDIDNNKIWAGKNNVWYDASGGSTGNPSTGANPTAINVSKYISQYGALVPFCSIGQWNTSTVNFGQSPFTFTPPTGFKSINTKNLKDVGSYNLPDTWGNFLNTPDLVWIKNRTEASGGGLWNTLLGRSSFLQTTNTNGPATTGSSFDTFLPNGFQLGVDTNITNKSGNAYVSWNWNKGKTPGFDIVSFGSNGGVMQVAHNLGQTPKFMIIKGVNGVTSWVTYHDSVGPLSNIRLDSTAAINTGTDWFGNTSPTSTHFTIGANFPATYSWLAYLWAEVPGFSKMGSWAGNSSTDGPFIHTGFRPRWILTKRYTSTGNWLVLDTLRNPFNDTTATVAVNTTDAEGVGAGGNWGFDILSNGFKIRGLNSEINTSGQSYMYVAFAESPFKYANAR